MADTQIALAVGYDQTTLTLIEDIVEDSPSLMPNEIVPSLGPVARRTLDQHTHYHGTRRVTLRYEHLSRANFDTLILFIFQNWTTGSAAITLRTLNEVGLYSIYNAIVEKPQPKTHFQFWHGGDIRDLQLICTIVEDLTPPDDGLLLEAGFGLRLETGDFLMLES